MKLTQSNLALPLSLSLFPGSQGTATHARVYLSGIIDEILNVRKDPFESPSIFVLIARRPWRQVENGPVLREIIVKVQDSDTIDRLCSELQEGWVGGWTSKSGLFSSLKAVLNSLGPKQ